MPGKIPFTIRMYGILLHEGRLLVCDEHHRGRDITKFPGGGLEFGEGTVDGLKREFREELGLEVEVTEHLYTTDFFQLSAFDSNIQVISIYYLVEPTGAFAFRTSDRPFDFEEKKDNAMSFRWIPLKELGSDAFSFPIDKKVAGLLIQRMENGRIS